MKKSHLWEKQNCWLKRWWEDCGRLFWRTPSLNRKRMCSLSPSGFGARKETQNSTFGWQLTSWENVEINLDGGILGSVFGWELRFSWKNRTPLHTLTLSVKSFGCQEGIPKQYYWMLCHNRKLLDVTLIEEIQKLLWKSSPIIKTNPSTRLILAVSSYPVSVARTQSPYLTVG